MVQLDSASESPLSQQAQLRCDELIELWIEDVSVSKVRYAQLVGKIPLLVRDA